MQRELKLATDVFDYQDAVGRVGHDDELLRAQAWEFLQTHPEHLRRIREATRAGDAASLVSAATTLRLALDDISGSRCLMQVQALERAARAGAIAQAVALTDVLEQELSELLLALDSVVSPEMMN